jgi:hypothetical protein
MTRFGKKAQKSSSSIQKLKLKRNKMINQEYAQNLNSKLAEKCRKALEKHYGGAVPTPKCLLKE